jgi:hypothetical protein
VTAIRPKDAATLIVLRRDPDGIRVLVGSGATLTLSCLALWCFRAAASSGRIALRQLRTNCIPPWRTGFRALFVALRQVARERWLWPQYAKLLRKRAF